MADYYNLAFSPCQCSDACGNKNRVRIIGLLRAALPPCSLRKVTTISIKYSLRDLQHDCSSLWRVYVDIKTPGYFMSNSCNKLVSLLFSLILLHASNLHYGITKDPLSGNIFASTWSITLTLGHSTYSSKHRLLHSEGTHSHSMLRKISTHHIISSPNHF